MVLVYELELTSYIAHVAGEVRAFLRNCRTPTPVGDTRHVSVHYRLHATLAVRLHLDPPLNVERTASGNRPYNRIAQIAPSSSRSYEPPRSRSRLSSSRSQDVASCNLRLRAVRISLAGAIRGTYVNPCKYSLRNTVVGQYDATGRLSPIVPNPPEHAAALRPEI